MLLNVWLMQDGRHIFTRLMLGGRTRRRFLLKACEPHGCRPTTILIIIMVVVMLERAWVASDAPARPTATIACSSRAVAVAAPLTVELVAVLSSRWSLLRRWLGHWRLGGRLLLLLLLLGSRRLSRRWGDSVTLFLAPCCLIILAASLTLLVHHLLHLTTN